MASIDPLQVRIFVGDVEIGTAELREMRLKGGKKPKGSPRKRTSGTVTVCSMVQLDTLLGPHSQICAVARSVCQRREIEKIQGATLGGVPLPSTHQGEYFFDTPARPSDDRAGRPLLRCPHCFWCRSASTRTGAAWVRDAVAQGARRLVFVGRDWTHVHGVMLQAIGQAYDEKERPTFSMVRGLLTWPNGATARVFTCSSPQDVQQIRGLSYIDAAWCDALTDWSTSREVYRELFRQMRGGKGYHGVSTSDDQGRGCHSCLAFPFEHHQPPLADGDFYRLSPEAHAKAPPLVAPHDPVGDLLRVAGASHALEEADSHDGSAGALRQRVVEWLRECVASWVEWCSEDAFHRSCLSEALSIDAMIRAGTLYQLPLTLEEKLPDADPAWVAFCLPLWGAFLVWRLQAEHAALRVSVLAPWSSRPLRIEDFQRVREQMQTMRTGMVR